jgi:hypothetical protein
MPNGNCESCVNVMSYLLVVHLLEVKIFGRSPHKALLQKSLVARLCGVPDHLLRRTLQMLVS